MVGVRVTCADRTYGSRIAAGLRPEARALDQNCAGVSRDTPTLAPDATTLVVDERSLVPDTAV